MKSLSIRDLKNNPSMMTRYLGDNESVFITKHSNPIGITIPLKDDLFSVGIKKVVVLEQYKEGKISLGKMAEFLNISKKEAMNLLKNLDIDWLEYEQSELDDQINVAKEILKNDNI